MRQYVSIFISILILTGAVIAYNLIVNREKQPRPQPKKVAQTAFVQRVKNGTIAIQIKESGRLVSKNRIEVYAEVQGVMENTSKEFKPGTHYATNEVLVKIRSNDYYANLQAQKSVLQNLITSVLPDLRLDYPEAYKKWDDYLKKFDMDKPIRQLPKTTSEKEKYFITGKNIYTTYYKTKNLEIVLQKYTLRAPFNGILTDALVTPGTVVRPGQKLGEFINPTIYELEVALSKSMLPEISVGKKVQVSDSEGTGKTWQGVISRINGRVNTSTQTVKVFIDVEGAALREGMYMQAIIDALPKENAYEVANNLLVNDSQLYTVEDSTLVLVPITILHRTKYKVIVSGLADHTQLVSNTIAGAFAGLAVEVKTLTD